MKKLMVLNAKIHQGLLDERMATQVAFTEVWMLLWKESSLEELCGFCMALVQVEGQCLGILNLLV